MMVIMCCLVLLFVPVLLGTAIMKLQREKAAGIVHRYMLGFFTLFLLFEVMMLVCKKAGMPFTSLCMLFSCLLVLICGITSVVCHKELLEIFKFKVRRQAKITYLFYAVIGVLSVVQVILIVNNTYAVEDDLVIGILQTIQRENTIAGGIIGLPVFYAYLSAIFSLEPDFLLYTLVPVWILTVSYFVCFLWADYLLEMSDKQQESKNKAFFLVCISILLLFGDYLFTTVSYHLYHVGWIGETTVIAVIIPFAIYIFIQKKYKKIVPFLLSAAGVISLVGIGIAKGTDVPLTEVSKLIWHVNMTVNSYGKYNALFYAALLCIFVMQNEKNRKLCYYNLAILALVWNPLVIKGLLYIFPRFNTYWQFLWLLPTLLVIAYAGTLLYNQIEEKVKKLWG